MKRILTITCMALVACTLLAQTFTSGKLRYEVVDATQKWVQIVPKNPDNDADVYQGISTSDFVTEVTYNGTTYTVVGVGAGAFANASIGSGSNRLPEGFIYVDNMAFYRCEGGSLILPSTLTLLSPTGLAGNLLQIVSVVDGNPVLAKLITVQHSNYNVICITNKEGNKLIATPGAKPLTFSAGGTTYLSVFDIPEQITEIGEYAFYMNKYLVRANIPSSVTKIGDAAFYDCEKITSVTITNPNTEIGNSVWSGCQSLTSLSLPQGLEKLGRHTFFYCGLQNLTLPEGMKSLGMMCFASNNLKTINLPSTMELLDSCCFQDNVELASINIKNVKKLGHFAFMGCTALKTITGNNKLEHLGTTALCRTGLIDAQLPEGLLRMDGNVFFRTTSLQTITIPSTVEYIEYSPIVGCTAVRRVQVTDGNEHFAELDSCLYEVVDGAPTRLVSVPSARVNKVLIVRDGVKILGRQCAREVALTEAYLPASVTDLEASVFSGVSTLTKVSCMASNPPVVGSGSFTTDAYNNATLYVPMASVEKYQQADGWKEFQNIEGVDTGGLRGDVNADGVVDVSDVNILINIMLGKDNASNYTGDANVDGEGGIDVSDVNVAINIMLGK